MTPYFEKVDNKQIRCQVLREANLNPNQPCDAEYSLYVYKGYAYILYKDVLYREPKGLLGLIPNKHSIFEVIKWFKEWYNKIYGKWTANL